MGQRLTGLAFLLGMWLISGPADAQGAEPSAVPSLQVDWNGERLSVSADAVPLADALRAVAGKTGLEILGIELLRGNASASFANLSLRDGLKVLLKDVGYALRGPSAEQPGFFLSIVSGPTHQPATTPTASAESDNRCDVPSAAGYVAENHRALHCWALDGDLQSLRQAALSDDSERRTLALRLLAELDPEQATELAAAASRDPDPNHRLNGLQILGDLDNPAATAALGDALADSNATIRHAAVDGLMGQTSADVLPLLERALWDPDESVRALALELLAQRGAAAVASVDAALGHSDPELRARARELREQMPAVAGDGRSP